MYMTKTNVFKFVFINFTSSVTYVITIGSTGAEMASNEL